MVDERDAKVVSLDVVDVTDCDSVLEVLIASFNVDTFEEYDVVVATSLAIDAISSDQMLG